MVDNTYRIKKETMTLIADRLRVLVGKTTPLTPADIAYYLERVVFTPQSYASSKLDLSAMEFKSNSTGCLPTIYSGIASNNINLVSMIPETHATGIIVE